MYCRKCGASAKDGDLFCRECGAVLKGSAQSDALKAVKPSDSKTGYCAAAVICLTLEAAVCLLFGLMGFLLWKISLILAIAYAAAAGGLLIYHGKPGTGMKLLTSALVVLTAYGLYVLGKNPLSEYGSGFSLLSILFRLAGHVSIVLFVLSADADSVRWSDSPVRAKLSGLKETARRFWYLPAVGLSVSILFGTVNYILLCMRGPYYFDFYTLFTFYLFRPALAACGFLSMLYYFCAPAEKKKSAVRGKNDIHVRYANTDSPDYEIPYEAYRDILTHTLLMVFTFGIYECIWIYRTTKWLNGVSGHPDRSPVRKLLLCIFVPFYNIYWKYQTAVRLDSHAGSRHISSEITVPCLILGIFLYLNIISTVLIQLKINEIVTAAFSVTPAGNDS